MTYAQGQQLAYLNGIPIAMSTLTGTTQSGNWSVAIGATPSTGPYIYTIDKFGLWNGYVLTATDVANLRDGVLTPAQINTGNPSREYWTMAGTNGANVQVGDPGITNFFGNTLTTSTVFRDPVRPFILLHLLSCRRPPQLPTWRPRAKPLGSHSML